MKIADITTTSMKVELEEAKILQKTEPREVNTRLGPTRVAECTIEDDTGTIILVLWGDQIDSIKEGDRINIKGGYVKEWNGNLQLNVGKFGKLSVLSQS
jgi:replication factor A1